MVNNKRLPENEPNLLQFHWTSFVRPQLNHGIDMIEFAKTIETIDSHTEGNPTRVIVGGVTIPEGDTLWEKKRIFETKHDEIRQMLNYEPRGGGLMCSVLLMPPLVDEADFSIIIMEQEGYVPMCGHCAIGTATTVVAAGMVEVEEPYTKVVLHTLAGLVEARVKVIDGCVENVTITNVDSFILLHDQEINVEDLGEIKVDIGYGGDFYPIVDADAIGLQLNAKSEPAIVKIAQKVRASIKEQLDIQHPEIPEIDECYQVQFISSKTTNGGNIRNTVVAPPGAMDRSPCGTGTSLLTSRAVEKGLISVNDEYIVEGPLGTFFTGKIINKEERNGINFYRPQVTGRAFITGFNKLVMSPNDPFQAGYQVGV